VPAWLIWIIAAAALAGAEALSLDLVLVMFAAGAGAGAITAAAGAPPAGQVAVAALVSVALLAFVRPTAKRHLLPGAGHVSGSAALVGQQAVVTRKVDGSDGRIRLNGSEWSARSFDDTQVIPDGTVVQVVKIDGATAVVWETPAL
jgi:membrane protein implicated in regulation of membrane protease activity